MNNIKKQLHELKLKIKKNAAGKEINFSFKSPSIGLAIAVIIALVLIALIIAVVMVIINQSSMNTAESALFMSAMPIYLV